MTDSCFEHELEALRLSLVRIAVNRWGVCHDEAHEYVQRTIVKAWQARESYRGESSVFTWLTRILANVYCDAQREVWARRVFSLEEVTSEEGATRSDVIADPFDMTDYLASEAKREELERALASNEFTVLRMRYDGLKFDEIAKACGILEGTAKSRYNRAKDRFIKQFSALGFAA